MHAPGLHGLRHGVEAEVNPPHPGRQAGRQGAILNLVRHAFAGIQARVLHWSTGALECEWRPSSLRRNLRHGLCQPHTVTCHSYSPLSTTASTGSHPPRISDSLASLITLIAQLVSLDATFLLSRPLLFASSRLSPVIRNDHTGMSCLPRPTSSR